MKRLIMLFSFLIPLLLTQSAYANSGGIIGIYEYNGVRINSVEVDLYKIADFNSHDYTFQEGFEPVDIGKMHNSELGEYGQRLAEIVQDPEEVTYTVNGEYRFADMNEGIYLVTFKDMKIGDYTYSALPIVLTMPDADQSYMLTLVTKLERNCPNCAPEPEPDSSKDKTNSNTRDKIYFYIKVFVILILFEALTLFVIIKKRKREDSNGKK